MIPTRMRLRQSHSTKRFHLHRHPGLENFAMNVYSRINNWKYSTYICKYLTNEALQILSILILPHHNCCLSIGWPSCGRASGWRRSRRRRPPRTRRTTRLLLPPKTLFKLNPSTRRASSGVFFFLVIFKIQRVQHALSVPLFSVFPASYPLLDSDNSADIY